MFCAARLVFSGREGVGSHFNVLRYRSRFPRYRGRQVPFSFFALEDSFPAKPRAWGPVFMFARPDSISAVPRASDPVFMFCAPGLTLGGTEGVRSLFHVLSSQTHFRRYRERRDPFSCFPCPNSSSAVSRPLGPVFISCPPGLVFGDAEGVGSRIHILRAWNFFRRYRGRRVPFSYFERPDSFSTVPRASGLVFMLCAPRLIFDGTEGAGSRFDVLRSLTRFRRYRGRRVPFSCFSLRNCF
jgi:hypothetical protein